MIAVLAFMKIKPFKLERYFAKHEFSAPYLLSSSDCEPVMLSELLALADGDCLALWNNLRLAYTESQGHPLLREEISKMYAGISKEDLLVLVPEEGIFAAMNVLLESGDHIVCTFPGYQSLYQVAESNNCRVSKWLPGKNLEFNVEDLFALLTDRTKLIVINFPHNPTGGMISRSDLEKIIETARKRNITVFSDEMYRLLEYDEKDRLPSVCELYENGVSLSGLSKTFGLPGLRIGWLATRNKAIQGELAAFKDYTTICSSAPSEVLGIMALRNKEKLRDNSLGIIRGNLALIEAFAARQSGWLDWKTPKAGSIAFPGIRIKESAADFCEQLVREKGIMLLPSEVYDYSRKCVRFGFGRKSLPEILPMFEAYITQKGY